MTDDTTSHTDDDGRRSIWRLSLSRHWSDRLIHLIFVPIVALFGICLRMGLNEWHPDDTTEQVLRFLAWDASILLCAFAPVLLVWALFAPRWLESGFRWCGEKLVRGLLIAISSTALLLAYYCWVA